MTRPRYSPFPWGQEVVSEKGQSLSGPPTDVSSIGSFSDAAWLSLAYFEMRSILARVLWNFNMQIDKASQEWMEQKEYTHSNRVFLPLAGPINGTCTNH